MSYAMTAALQSAVYGALSGDATLGGLVNGAIYDAIPKGPVPSLLVRLGPERVRDRSDQTVGGALHDFVVMVQTDNAGFKTAKQVAARISDVLLEADLTLTRGRVVTLNFLRAQARRRRDRREIEIWFRAFVEDVAAV